MEQTSQSELLDIFIDLDMFSRLSANTSIHLDRNNHFVITAQRMSHIPGAQSVANYYKSHSNEKIIADLDMFARKFIKLLDAELDKANFPETKTQAIQTIRLASREFKLAFEGLDDVVGGGMRGLLLTLNNDPKMVDILVFMCSNINRLKHAIDELDELTQFDSLYCPEADFTDEDWIRTLQIVPKLQKEYAGIFKYYINYSSILTLNQLSMNFTINHWDEICRFDNGGGLFLGGLPIINYNSGRNDLSDLKNLGIGAVLSVVEVFENNSTGYIYSPITPTDWINSGVYHYQTPSPDFCQIGLETALKGVEFIHWNIRNGRKVYVHCKSGKSRSFFVTVSYFMKYYNYTADNAIAYIKSRRTQAGFGTSSKKMILLRKIEALLSQKKISTQ